ncbi:hypothetical protein DL98DRAFT_657810 [Cadophora sp. DSE1049]|nr:hypothetical protein DL98DRAFT_657810 [Cadophora sp. DSE1049]
MSTPPGPKQFGSLPYELRIQVWRYAIGANPCSGGRTIRIYFRERLIFEPARTILAVENDLRNGVVAQPQMHVRAHFRFEFSLGAESLETTFRGQNVNREVRREFYPNILHLHSPDGRPTLPIRFNAKSDTIFMDLQSLRALYDFARPAIPGSGLLPAPGFGPSNAERQMMLIGFDQIQKLSTPLEGPVVDGVEFLNHRVLTGLTQPVGSITTYPGTDPTVLIPNVRAEYAGFPAIINDPAQILAISRSRYASRDVANQAADLFQAWRGFVQPMRMLITHMHAALLDRLALHGFDFFAITLPPPSPPPPPLADAV